MSESMPTLVKRVIAAASNRIRVAMPAKIEKYDHVTQKAEVTPLLQEGYSDGQLVDYPVISGVPVIFPRSGGAAVHFPVKKGDTVLLIFCDRDISRWLQTGAIRPPDSRREHALTDAVAIPGLLPFSAAAVADNNEDVILSFAGSCMRIKPNGDIRHEAPNVFMTGNLHVDGNVTTDGTLHAVQAISTDADLNAAGEITSGGDVTSQGDFIAGNITLKGHIHTVTPGGPGTAVDSTAAKAP